MKLGWEDARERPIITVVGVFIVGLIGVSLALYLVRPDHEVWTSIASGIACGTVLAATSLRRLKSPNTRLARVSAFEMILGASGIAIFVIGIVRTESKALMAGFLIVAFSILLVTARWAAAKKDRGIS
jgi:cytochrome c biogenesis factor